MAQEQTQQKSTPQEYKNSLHFQSASSFGLSLLHDFLIHVEKYSPSLLKEGDGALLKEIALTCPGRDFAKYMSNNSGAIIYQTIHNLNFELSEEVLKFKNIPEQAFVKQAESIYTYDYDTRKVKANISTVDKIYTNLKGILGDVKKDKAKFDADEKAKDDAAKKAENTEDDAAKQAENAESAAAKPKPTRPEPISKKSSKKADSLSAEAQKAGSTTYTPRARSTKDDSLLGAVEAEPLSSAQRLSSTHLPKPAPRELSKEVMLENLAQNNAEAGESNLQKLYNICEKYGALNANDRIIIKLIFRDLSQGVSTRQISIDQTGNPLVFDKKGAPITESDDHIRELNQQAEKILNLFDLMKPGTSVNIEKSKISLKKNVNNAITVDLETLKPGVVDALTQKLTLASNQQLSM